MDEAVHEFEGGHFPEARALFEQAHALYPNARTFRGIGMAEFELRNYKQCAAALTSALESHVRPLDGALRKDAEDLLARANGFLMRLRFANPPAGGTIRIDGARVAVTSEQWVVLDIGEHVVELESPGIVAERHDVSARGGDSRTINFVLQSVNRVDSPAENSASRTAPPPTSSAPSEREPVNRLRGARLYGGAMLDANPGLQLGGGYVARLFGIVAELQWDPEVFGGPRLDYVNLLAKPRVGYTFRRPFELYGGPFAGIGEQFGSGQRHTGPVFGGFVGLGASFWRRLGASVEFSVQRLRLQFPSFFDISDWRTRFAFGLNVFVVI